MRPVIHTNRKQNTKMAGTLTWLHTVWCGMSSLLTEYGRLASRRQVEALVGVGIGVWVVATLLFRIAGQFLLPVGEPLFVAGVFVATVPLMWMLAFTVYSVLDIDLDRRVVAAILLATPGMVLDALLVPFFPGVFPNMDPAAAPAFAGLLFLAYATVLVTGFVPRSQSVLEEPAPEDARAAVEAEPPVDDRTRGDDDASAPSSD